MSEKFTLTEEQIEKRLNRAKEEFNEIPKYEELDVPGFIDQYNKLVNL